MLEIQSNQQKIDTLRASKPPLAPLSKSSTIEMDIQPDL